MKKIIYLLFLFAFLPLQAQNFWVSANGPYAGSIRAIAINSTGHIFAGTYGSGVYRSTDNGNSWVQLNNDFSYSKITAIVINQSEHIFVGTDGEGIYRSTDNGNTWTELDNGLTTTYIYSLAISNTGSIFAGTFQHIFRSTNNGNNWVQVARLYTRPAVVNSIVINKSIIYAGDSYIYRSTDNGDTWTTTSFPGDSYTQITSMVINNDGNIFVGHNYYTGVLRSTDNGNNWTQLVNGPNMEKLHVESLTCNSADDLFAGTDGNGILRSTDKGSTWTVINSGLGISSQNSNIPALTLNDNEYVFAGTDNGNGMFRSAEPTAYNLSVISPHGTVLRNPNQPGFHYGSSVTLTAIPDTGYTFSEWSGNVTGSTNPITITMDEHKNITANYKINTYTLSVTATNGTVIKTPDLVNYDHGSNVTLTATPVEGYSFSGWSGDATGLINPLTVTMNSNKNINANFAINTYTLTVTSVNGTVTKDPNQTNYSYNSNVTLTANPSIGYSFTGWSGDTTGLSNPIAVTMNRNKNITANFSVLTHALTITSVNGTVNKNPDQTSYNYGSKVILTAIPSTGYEFKDWSGDATGSTNPLSVIIDGDKNITANFTSITSVDNSGRVPAEFSLSQNYPNPFNPITLIQYSIPSQSFVSLKIYDLLGNEVTTLINEYKSAGYYEVNFNGSELPSGTYFYRIQAGSFINTKKFVLLK